MILTPPLLYWRGHYRFSLAADYPWPIGEAHHPDDHRIVVPSGFTTDGASIPRCLWWWLPPHGDYLPAAIIHDYLYARAGKATSNGKGYTREQSDRIFYRGMLSLGIPTVKAWLMWKAVRVMGWTGWGRR